MKLSLLVVLGLLPMSVAADEVGEPSLAELGYSAVVGVLVEYFEVDTAGLPALLAEYQSEPDGTALLKRIQGEVKKGDARLEDSAYVVTRSGQRARVTSVREWIYPTEYDPVKAPKTVTGDIDDEVVLSTHPTPKAFEIRNVGTILEVEPTVSGGHGSVQLEFTAERVTFQGMWQLRDGVERFEQPVFHSARTSPGITLNPDRSEMFGTFGSMDPEQADKRVLGFVTVLHLYAISKADADDPPRPDPALEAEAQARENFIEDPFSVPDEPHAGVMNQHSQISLITEHIEVDAAVAGEIVRGFNGVADAASARHKLSELIERGEARILEIASGVSPAGERVRVKAVEEVIYPTVYDPPQLPQTVTGPIGGGGLNLMTPVSAAAFEIREAGFSIEADLHCAADRQSIEVTIMPERVEHVRGLVYGEAESEGIHPLFEMLRLQTAAVVADGTSLLIGIHSLETARAAKAATAEEQAAVRDRRVMVFITGKIKVQE